jgi:hypothetical protein
VVRISEMLDEPTAESLPPTAEAPLPQPEPALA